MPTRIHGARPLMTALAAGAVSLAGAASAAAADVAPMKPKNVGAHRLTLVGTPTKNAVLDRLKAAPRRSVPQVLDDANRQATIVDGHGNGALGENPPGFAWQAGGSVRNPDDQNTTKWFPQGLTGSGDATKNGLWAGRRLFLTSWYARKSEDDTSTIAPGVRVSFSRAEDLATSRYRHALLVRPVTGKGGQPSIAQVGIHAGGMAWYQRWLYVADTDGGLRVFDMKRIREVDDASTTKVGCTRTRCRAAGYKYVVPQVARYRYSGPRMSFSAVSLDRSTPTPTLAAVEYRDGEDGAPLVRWRIDPSSGLLRGARRSGRTAKAVDAWRLRGVTNAQGAVTHGDRVAISTSAGNSAGRLWRGRLGGPVGAEAWVEGGEDLTYAPGSGRIYTATEHEGERAVIGVPGF